ncbi:hypothetical protein FRX31_027655 [Thalictrum thalictroides]|uniref:Uncharacterized protein n=1 Tax=Thalictrum thalictroides TaxID=46969 RepID=A0A7J6VDR5_THATH|nr:hypothetical protein FRX31_027655 [Thalictrum thalictroides]
MFAATLKTVHGEESSAANNYVANVSRVLYFVHSHLVETNNPPKHWADLVSTDVNVYERREETGQTKSTTTNYMKNQRTLFEYILKAYVYSDPTFPKGFDLCPCVTTVTKIKLLEHYLGLMYKRKTKQLPGELFVRKTKESETLPQHTKVEATIKNMEADLPGGLTELEALFGNEGMNGSAEEKKTTCTLMISLLWTSKQRSGVVVNMTLGEWESRRHHLTSTIVTVSDHKTGDKEPASLVIDDDMEAFLTSFHDFYPLEPYSKFPSPDDAIEKICSHEIMETYPNAVIDVQYVLGLRDRFDCELMDQRANILYDEVTAAGYHKENISDHAISDVAKKRKIHHFLTNMKFQKKTIRRVLTRFP